MSRKKAAILAFIWSRSKYSPPDSMVSTMMSKVRRVMAGSRSIGAFALVLIHSVTARSVAATIKGVSSDTVAGRKAVALA